MRRNKIKTLTILVFLSVTVVLVLAAISSSGHAPVIQPSQIPVIQPSQGLKFILVTGFEPFGGYITNASWEAVQHLNVKYFDNMVVVAVQLPVVWGKANEKLIELIKYYEPISVIGFGQAGNGPVRLETTAQNARGNIPDNEGMMPRTLQIYQDAPISLETSLPLDRIKDRLYAVGIPVTVSHDAGRYLCNDIFYTMMYYRDSANTNDLLGGFIHVPPLNAKVSTEEGNTIIFDQRQLQKTAEIVIQTIADMLNE